MAEQLTVLLPGGAASPRCAGVLEAALAGRRAEVLTRLEGPLHGRRLLFVLSLDEGGFFYLIYLKFRKRKLSFTALVVYRRFAEKTLCMAEPAIRFLHLFFHR